MVWLCLGGSVCTGARSKSSKSSINGSAPDCRYCKIKGSERALYILRIDESRSEWSLITFASPKAQLTAPQWIRIDPPTRDRRATLARFERDDGRPFGKAHHPASGSSPPILFRLPLHCRTSRVLALEPVA